MANHCLLEVTGMITTVITGVTTTMAGAREKLHPQHLAQPLPLEEPKTEAIAMVTTKETVCLPVHWQLPAYSIYLLLTYMHRTRQERGAIGENR